MSEKTPVPEQQEWHSEPFILIAAYENEEEALALADLLTENDIPCTLRNAYSNMIFGRFVDIGGVRVEAPQSYATAIEQLLSEKGFQLPNNMDLPIGKLSRWLQRGATQDKRKRQWVLTLILLLFLILMLGALFFLN